MTAPRLTRTPALLTLLLQMECEIGGITSVLLWKRKNLSGTNIDLTAPTKSSQKRTLLSAGDWEENTSAGKVKDPSLNAWWNSGYHICVQGPSSFDLFIVVWWKFEQVCNTMGTFWILFCFIWGRTVSIFNSNFSLNKWRRIDINVHQR